MKLMTARYAGKCTMCTAGVKAGDAILYGGRGNVRHTDCSRPTGTAEHVCNVTCTTGNCPVARSDYLDRKGRELDDSEYGDGATYAYPSQSGSMTAVEVDYAATRPTRRNGYRTYTPRKRQYDLNADLSGRNAYLADGTRMTDRASRCEDAPCCGCCD